MKKPLRAQSIKSREEGFTLLEVVIAGAIGIVVAFAIEQASINATQAERASELDVAYMALMSRLENAIDDPVNCASLWQTWDGVSTSTPAFNPAKFDPTTPPFTTFIDLIQDGAPTDIAKSINLAGAPQTGLTFPNSATLRMQFTEPVQVAENTYDWTFKITTQKIGTAVSLSGSPMIMKRIRLEITTTGPPSYTAIYCGPPVSPEANQQIPMLRFTATSSNCNDSDTNKDTSCRTEFGPLYVAAGLQDLVAYRMVYSTKTGFFADQFRFSVVQNINAFSNSNDGTRDGGTTFVIASGGTCQVACIRNTAPLRFTRDFFANNIANKTQRCQEHVGFSYVAASPNDLIRYGFKLGSGAVFSWDPNAPGAVFDGGNFGCMMGWPTPGSGPILDCGAGASALNFPLACVLR